MWTDTTTRFSLINWSLLLWLQFHSWFVGPPLWPFQSNVPHSALLCIRYILVSEHRDVQEQRWNNKTRHYSSHSLYHIVVPGQDPILATSCSPRYKLSLITTYQLTQAYVFNHAEICTRYLFDFDALTHSCSRLDSILNTGLSERSSG